MSGFTKLDSGIVHSTIWVQPHDVLRVWVALLALADQHGFARTAAPALANLCMIPVERMREILVLLESPDPDSRTTADDGRRISKVEGGWMLVNHAAYRATRDPESDRARKREWDRQHRPSGHQRAKQSDDSPTTVRRSPLAPTQAEAEAEAGEIIDPSDPSRACAREAGSVGCFEPAEEVPRETPARPTPAGTLAIALGRAGFRVTSINPTLLAYLAEGGTVEHATAVAAFSECQGKPASYVLAFARRELAEAGRAPPVGTSLTTTGGSVHPVRPRRMSKQAEGMLALERMKSKHRGAAP